MDLLRRDRKRPPSGTERPIATGIFLARLCHDEFIPADAGYEGGEFTIPVVTFDSKRRELNMDGSAGGWTLVGILSESDEPIEGYKIEQCDTIRGNSVKKAVTWQGNSDVSKLTGKLVKLQFVIQSMKIFAFQFVCRVDIK